MFGHRIVVADAKSTNSLYAYGGGIVIFVWTNPFQNISNDRTNYQQVKASNSIIRNRTIRRNGFARKYWCIYHLKTFERTIIKTGLFIALPPVLAQVRPRSGLAAKKGITVLNSPGTVDADYRGEIGVILVNLSDEDFVIQMESASQNGDCKTRTCDLATDGRLEWNRTRCKWIWEYRNVKNHLGRGGFMIIYCCLEFIQKQGNIPKILTPPRLSKQLRFTATICP